MEKRVFVAKCDDYEYENVKAAVGRVLDAFGGAPAIVDKNAAKSGGTSAKGVKKVLVKPNLLVPRKPEAAATTHPAVVRAVCEAFIKAGAEVSIIDSTGGPHTKLVLKLLYNGTGMKEAASQSGAKLLYNTKSIKTTFPQGRMMKESELLAPVLDADIVITVAKAKTHSFQAMTGCVKNLFGTIPGMGKPLNHRRFSKREDFAGMLVDVCERIRPALSILDGITGMEGAGPSGGDPKRLGAIVGGLSPYAVDLAQCHLMGLRADSVYTLVEAASRSLAPMLPDELEWLGDDPSNIRAAFKPAVANKEGAVPAITEKCVGCGDCARLCPMGCIRIENKLAAIGEEKCIKCYCCHEFCPAKAILI